MGCYELVCEAEQLRKKIAELEASVTAWRKNAHAASTAATAERGRAEKVEADLATIYRAWQAWQKVREIGGGRPGEHWDGCAPPHVTEALDKAVEDMWKA